MSARRIKEYPLDKKSLNPYPEYRWTRPSDWLTLPSVGSSDQKCVMLLAIYDNDSNYVAFTATGNFTVDWGDGSSTVNYNTGVTAQYKYDYASISAGTLTSDGFKQVIVTVTPQAGQSLATIDFQKYHSDCATTYINQAWLDIVIGVTTSFQLANYSTNLANFPVLKQLSINNYGSTLATTMLRASAQNVAKVFINKALQIASSGPFQYAYNLEEVYINPACTSADLSNLFLYCTKLKRAPLFNTYLATNVTNMFQNCYELEEVPAYNFGGAALLNFSSMFSGCYSLKSVPLFNTSTGTTFTNMFQNCYNLQSVPLFNLSSASNVSSMFTGCYSLQSVPKFTFSSGSLDATGMFSSCFNLQSIPAFVLGTPVTIAAMFQNCYNLKSIPDIFSSSTITSGFNTIFSNCFLLTKTPPIPLANATTMSTNPLSMGILEVDRWNISSLTVSPTFTSRLRRCQFFGGKYSISYASNQLSRTALNEIIDNLGTAATTQTLTITSNPGATVNPIYSRSSTTTSGSTTISIADTSSFVTGMQVTGTGISDARSVTIQDSGDTITLAGHGLANGKLVSFATIVTTTGIAVYTPYYVINATTDTFQLSLTNGGAAIALTTDGTGTILYQTLITNIVANTSVTIDVPASASGTNTLAYRNLNTQFAIMKRWTVTG